MAAEARGGRRVLIALACLLLAGAGLRLLFVLAWQPRFMGWPDSASYIDVSQGELFGNELRPAGYPLVLRLLHMAAPSLTFVIVLQHLLGLATPVLLYLAVARSGAPRALGLVPRRSSRSAATRCSSCWPPPGAAPGLLGSYFVAEQHAVGKTGLSRNGIWNVYGRVAPFADCRKFTPPPGTEALCETTPTRSARLPTSTPTWRRRASRATAAGPPTTTS
jgi:hypothetical protein